MAQLARNVLNRGVASGGMALVVPTQAGGGCLRRAMSTSSTARSTGSLIGRFSVKVKGDNVNQAMEEIERRERMVHVPQMSERHRYHEKGFNKTRKQKARKIWREEFDAATRQLKWMTFLKDKGVPIPGQRVGERK